MLKLLFFISIFLLWMGYRFYGRYLERFFGVDPNRKTPAHLLEDGRDYTPTKAIILFGHSFSSIAGAGPIVGPIVACMYFGWLPAILWIIIASIFIGGMHDFATLFMSVRNQGRSIAEIIRIKLGKRMYILILILFIFIAEYVLIVFLDLTASGFANNGSVATASLVYIVLAFIFGWVLRVFKHKKLLLLSLPFVLLIFVTVYFAYLNPIVGVSKNVWQTLLILYCLLASVLPVQVLLQPRDYLSSYMLYFALFVGFIGIFFVKGLDINYAYFIPFAERSSQALKMFPVLFITIACGAVSGFHSLIESGTTSKQLDNEKDAKVIGYGGMLTEAVLGLVALVTIMILTKPEASNLASPLAIFSKGFGKFFTFFGASSDFGNILGFLIISTFLLTTLDTVTRISRYIFQELFAVHDRKSVYYSSIAVLLLPLVFCYLKITDSSGNLIPAWKVVWPLFGTANQLLGGIGLLTVLIWLYGKFTLKKMLLIIIPALFMFVMSIYSLVNTLIMPNILIIKVTCFILLIITILLIYFSSTHIFKNCSHNGMEGL